MTMIRVIIKVATGVNTSYTPSDSFFIIRFFFPIPALSRHTYFNIINVYIAFNIPRHLIAKIHV